MEKKNSRGGIIALPPVPSRLHRSEATGKAQPVTTFLEAEAVAIGEGESATIAVEGVKKKEG
ncbi:hypothetical protein TanjilG_16472 [Lupinus angustifolius]|uniref:Uncharacterized protein n=1 Tax=Lupinus angustifolius TaxID=3871 RepID=A0A1J7HSA4_LUPAN|nr:hypothetical protein TanjilG_16472 [Lupinus angustifolius]